MAPLTAKQARFVEEYLVDLNATSAARRAGYSARTAKEIARQVFHKPQVTAAIAEASRKRSLRTAITADRVLIELWHIATADASGLIEYRRGACRHCWGQAFRYQRTAGEMARDLAEHARSTEAAASPFDVQGGDGYDSTKGPNPKCPECHGDGLGQAMLADTRDLPPELLALYAGVKVSKDGIEVKTHDKVKALELLGKHLKLWTERVEIERPRVRVKDMTGRKRPDESEANEPA